MSDLIIVCPTKGRPESAQRLYDAIRETSDADVAFAVDEQDPELSNYPTSLPVWVVPQASQGMVWPLNWVADNLVKGYPYKYIGFMGDDHIPRTQDWDKIFIEELEKMKVGVVYGNDLLMGERIPTAVVMTANIPLALGYMAPNCLHHLFVDNAWKDWGQGTSIRYFEDVIIEHLHPLAGKADWDPTYEECNNPNIEHDRVNYGFYVENRLQDDLETLRAIVE